jgi:hypothetical protein
VGKKRKTGQGLLTPTGKGHWNEKNQSFVPTTTRLLFFEIYKIYLNHLFMCVLQFDIQLLRVTPEETVAHSRFNKLDNTNLSAQYLHGWQIVYDVSLTC